MPKGETYYTSNNNNNNEMFVKQQTKSLFYLRNSL